MYFLTTIETAKKLITKLVKKIIKKKTNIYSKLKFGIATPFKNT